MRRPKFISAIKRRTAVARATGVPADTLRLNPATQSYAASLGIHLYPDSTVRALIGECKNFHGRIRALLQTQLHRRMIRIDPDLIGEERWQGQDACIADMRKLFADRPWLTLVDGEIFALAWRQGAEWHDRICRSESPSSAPSSSSRLPRTQQSA